MEIKSPLQIASDKLIAWASLVWHYNKTCFPALDWHWELLKIIFPSCGYPFWKMGSNRTGTAWLLPGPTSQLARASLGLMLNGLFIRPSQPLYYPRRTPHALKQDLLPSLLDFWLCSPPGYSPPLTCSISLFTAPLLLSPLAVANNNFFFPWEEYWK